VLATEIQGDQHVHRSNSIATPALTLASKSFPKYVPHSFKTSIGYKNTTWFVCLKYNFGSESMKYFSETNQTDLAEALKPSN